MQDKIMKFLAYQGKISVICASTTELVEKARKIHDLSPVATAAFGRLLTISSNERQWTTWSNACNSR